MLRVIGCITQQHDLRLVVVAGLICFLACFITMNMLWRAHTHFGNIRAAWLSGAALVFAAGVWTTHFISMLAYRSDILIGYAAPETVLSIVTLCGGAGVIFLILINVSEDAAMRASVGALLGAIVSGMHFIGAYAIRFAGSAQLDPGFVIAALLLGMGLAATALVLGQRLTRSSHRLLAAALLTAAITGLHFTGMAAITVVPGPVEQSDEIILGTPLLATIVIAATAVILLLSLFCSFVDQHLAWRTMREEGSLRHIAHHDNLTGLPNRLAFGHALGEILKEAASLSAGCAVLCLDLDRFKLVNDLHGHQAGDEVLKRTSERLQAITRPVDMVARISGDEFVIAMAPATTPAGAGLLGARVVSALAEPILLDGQQICIGASVGIAMYPQDGATAEDLLRHADMALYQSKRDGRNAHRFFDRTMNERLRTRQNLEQELRRGIEAGEFQLYYQPLFQVEDQRIIGYEALIRWNHPTRGLVSPAAFIEIAEESGLIVPLGRWVLETACQEASLWDSALQVSVNVSPIQFQQPDLADVVADILARTGFPPHRLELEMTESMLMHHADQALATLRKLRGYGVRLSLDDFGTGYSSLSYLRRYPFNKIKIDRSFIQSLGEENESGVLARAIVALGHSLGMEVTAEGVETFEQYDFLEKEACDQVQGYLFGRPMPASEIQSNEAEVIAEPGALSLRRVTSAR